MKWVDALADDDKHAETVKENIRARLRSCLWDVHISLAASGAATAASSSSAASAGAVSRTQRPIVAALRKAQREKDPYGHSSSDEEEEGEEGELGADGEAWARERLDVYLRWCKSDAARGVRRMDWPDVLNWWRVKGRGQFPNLFVVFQSLLAVGAGAAALERDFSIAGLFVRPQRSMLDAAMVEMLLFLHVKDSLIPAFSKISEIPPSQVAERALPKRLRNKADFRKFLDLDRGQKAAFEKVAAEGLATALGDSRRKEEEQQQRRRERQQAAVGSGGSGGSGESGGEESEGSEGGKGLSAHIEEMVADEGEDETDGSGDEGGDGDEDSADGQEGDEESSGGEGAEIVELGDESVREADEE